MYVCVCVHVQKPEVNLGCHYSGAVLTYLATFLSFRCICLILFVFLSVGLYVCIMYVCIYVCVHTSACVYVYVCIAYMHICIYVHVYMCTHSHVCICVYMHLYMRLAYIFYTQTHILRRTAAL